MENINRAIKDPLLASFANTLERCSKEHQVCENCTRRTECLDLWDKLTEDFSTSFLRPDELEIYTQKFQKLR